jgi:hypothetical protein
MTQWFPIGTRGRLCFTLNGRNWHAGRRHPIQFRTTPSIEATGYASQAEAWQRFAMPPHSLTGIGSSRLDSNQRPAKQSKGTHFQCPAPSLPTELQDVFLYFPPIWRIKLYARGYKLKREWPKTISAQSLPRTSGIRLTNRLDRSSSASRTSRLAYTSHSSGSCRRDGRAVWPRLR